MWVNENVADQHRCPHGVEQTCVGKKCMAWRWGYVNKVESQSPTSQTFSAEEVGVAAGKFPPNTRFYARRGFCGLAGLPG